MYSNSYKDVEEGPLLLGVSSSAAQQADFTLEDVFFNSMVFLSDWHPEYRRQIVDNFYFNAQGWRMSVDSYKEMLTQRDMILELIITDEMNEFDKVRAVHKWLAENVSYNTDVWSWERFDRFGDGWNPDFQPVRYAFEHQMAWSALVLRTTVCAGYADAFVYLLEPLDIEAIFIFGPVTTPNGSSFPHAWNLVQLSESWYHVDVTWNRFYWDDKPIVTYDWFLLSDWAMRHWGQYTRSWNADAFPAAPAGYEWDDSLWLVFDRQMWRWMLVSKIAS